VTSSSSGRKNIERTRVKRVAFVEGKKSAQRIAMLLYIVSKSNNVGCLLLISTITVEREKL
jgi:hypothetical protein